MTGEVHRRELLASVAAIAGAACAPARADITVTSPMRFGP
ncbi:MAG: hypothetical protein QOH98_520, partial [Methylobacteriaceae bacterium]|nr:hypothetical protein [Methylobacteriaceae bacterium]